MQIVETKPEQPVTAISELQWSPGWKPALAVFLAGFAALVLLFFPTVKKLIVLWDSASFSHCYLILPISIYLVWTERNRVLPLTPRPYKPALLLFLLNGLVFLAGQLGNVNMLEQLALVSNIVVLAWVVFGSEIAKQFRFPLGFLFFAVPIGDSLVPPLQDFTAVAVANLLNLTRIPVFFEGHYLIVPNGTWEVAEACSGSRYLISSFVLGLVFAHLVFRSWKRRLGFVALSIVFPIIANALRAYGIVVLGYLSNNRLAAGVDHLIYGWIFFSFVTLVLFSIGFRWRDTDSSEPNTPPSSGIPGAPTPVIQFVLACVVAVLLSAVPLGASRVVEARNHPPEPTGESIRPSLAWTPITLSTPRWTADTDTDLSTTSQCYTNGSARVCLHVVFYTLSGEGIDLQHSGGRLINREFEILGERNREVTIDGHRQKVHEIVTRPAPTGQKVIWTFFWVNREFTTSGYAVKALQAKARLSGSAPASAIVGISADYAVDPKEALPLLQNFLDSLPLGQQLSRSYR